MTTQFEWTDDNIAIARHGFGMGVPASHIGREIGCSRNAVIGKMARLGIKSANPRGHQLGDPAPWKRAVSKPKPPKARPNMTTISARAARKPEPPPIPVEKPVEAPSGPPPNARTFDELAAGECRWPFGDGPYLFCGEPMLKDRPYCRCHCKIAYEPTPGLTRQRKQYEMAA